MTIDPTVFIRCRKCGNPFGPDLKTKLTWVCPGCQEKNPNLKRHYRSVADLCILGLIATVIIAGRTLKESGLTVGVMLAEGHAVLLIATIVSVYRSRSPWTDLVAKTLIWVVFGLALAFNVLLPLALDGVVNIPFIIVYAVVFPYLIWLDIQARKCTAPAR